MSASVIAIGLDACSPVLLESWLARGLLPQLAKIRALGAYGWLRNPPQDPYESSWAAFLHGATVRTTGQWGHQQFDASNYRATEEPSYEFGAYPPFYSLNPERRVAIFDLNLASPTPQMNGIQVFGWGTEDNQVLRVSDPPALMSELVHRHGQYQVFTGQRSGVAPESVDEEVFSYRVPNIYDRAALNALADRLIDGVRQRTGLIRDLLQREHWDLFAANYAEPHIAGHLLWHLDQRHPLADEAADETTGTGPLLAVMQRIDAAVGELLPTLPANARVTLFSVFGMKPNALDLPTTLFLPEFLFRWQWGESAMAAGDPQAEVPTQSGNDFGHWKEAIWSLRTSLGDSLLESPHQQEARNDPLDWNPLNWYRPLWSRMRAFALPSYSHGMIRLNVQGREGSGCVAIDEYADECERLVSALHELVDARSGRRVVREVIRTRVDSLEDTLGLGPADLIVHWDEQAPYDCVDSPAVGRIGPVPYFRTGGHATNGFCLAFGPGIPAGSDLPEGASVSDLTASLLEMMGDPVPDYMEGKPMWNTFTQANKGAR